MRDGAGPYSDSGRLVTLADAPVRSHSGAPRIPPASGANEGPRQRLREESVLGRDAAPVGVPGRDDRDQPPLTNDISRLAPGPAEDLLNRLSEQLARGLAERVAELVAERLLQSALGDELRRRSTPLPNAWCEKRSSASAPPLNLVVIHNPSRRRSRRALQSALRSPGYAGSRKAGLGRAGREVDGALGR